MSLGPRARLRRTGWLAAGATGALLLAACTTAAPGGRQPGSRQAGPNHLSAAAANPMLDTGSSLGGQPAPDIHLINQFGQRMSLSQFRGKVVILAFVDSECTTICPLTTVSMVEAKQLLGPAGASVQLLGVDANPQAVTRADTMSYSRAHGMVNQWDFLTGSLAQLRAVWRAYHIGVQIQQGQIDHTPALFVIDQRGRERTVYLTQMSFASLTQSAQVLARQVASLLPGHPALRGQQSLAYIPGTKPSSPVTLPGVPSGSVTLGPGRSRLVMFFATWVTQTSGLRAHLLALNRYVSDARHGRLPPLTAVDEGATEPSPDAAAAYLKGLGAPLRYPVGEDITGKVADGYRVQDQPWFVLVSASGKIVWKHDGWLGVHALEAAVGGK